MTSQFRVISDIWDALETELQTLITAEPALAYNGVKPDVYQGHADQHAQRDYIVIGDITEGSALIANLKLAPYQRNLEYLQHIKIVTVRPGAENKEARDAAILIAEKVDEMISADPSLGLSASVVKTYHTLRTHIGRITSINTTHTTAANGWRCNIDFKLQVEVRLLP